MLILHVSQPSRSSASPLQGRFGDHGGTIGRAADCTLVLPDPDKHISRVQAEVRSANGQYVLLNRSAVNPLLLNGRPVSLDESRPLRHDDEITVAQFVLRVELARSTGSAAAPIDDPFQDLIPRTVVGQAGGPFESVGRGSWPASGSAAPADNPSAPFIPDDAFADLARFAPTPQARRDAPAGATGGTSRASPSRVSPSAAAGRDNEERAQADLLDPFAAPVSASPHKSDPLGLATASDPLNLGVAAKKNESIDDLFGLGSGATDPLGAGSPLAEPAIRDAKASNLPGAMPDLVPEINASMKLPKLKSAKPSVGQVYRSWENPEEISKTLVVVNRSTPTPLNAQSLASMAQDAANAHKLDFEPTPKTRTTAMLDDLNRQSMSAARAGSAPLSSTSDPVPSSSEPDFQLLKAFLVGAGLKELPRLSGSPGARPLDAATMQRIGELLRQLSQGTVELLASRAIAKKEMRAQVTVIVSKNNNPLKFSPDAGTALAHLLAARPARGFIDPAAAVRDAFDDLNAHQIGFVAGMRAAMQGLIARFDPHELEQRLKKKSMLDAMLPINRKAKLWELFNEMYGDLAREAQDDFEVLFGREFLRAYEAQIDAIERKDQP